MSGAVKQLAAIAVGFFTLEAALWSPPRNQVILGMCSLAWMVVVTIARREPSTSLGLDRCAWSRGLWMPALAAVIAVCSTVALVFINGGILLPANSGRRLFGYTTWAFVQEFMLLTFFFCGMERIVGARRAVWISSIVFAVAHLPNPLLTGITLVVALIFTTAFLRYRSVYTIAVAHAVLGMTFALVVPAELHHGMRVGWGYSRWNSPVTASVPNVSHRP